MNSRIDAFGNDVLYFALDAPHERLQLVSETTVALMPRWTDLDPEATPEWDEVADASLTMADYLSHKLYTAPNGELTGMASELRADRPLQTAQKIVEKVHGSLSYVRGVTSVHTSANEAFTDGAGVCQDFAHLALAMTKSVGLPSRYVSGYFHPDADASVGEEIAGESHA